MELNKVKFTISLPIVAVLAIASVPPALGRAQGTNTGTNTWNYNNNSANPSVAAAPVAAPVAPVTPPKYYVEPTAELPRAVVPQTTQTAVDSRFAPSDLEQTLSAGRIAVNTAPLEPAVPVYAPAQLQSGQPPQPMARTPAYGNNAPYNGQNNGQMNRQQNGQPNGQAPAYPNPYAYNNAPQNNQPYGNGYNNGYNNGFPGGFNSFPGGFGSVPSFGNFPSMGSPNTNFSPFGFW